MSKDLVIINPNAGRKKGLHDWPQISALLEAAEINYNLIFTFGQFDAMKAARKAVEEGCRRIIVVGGDGTFNEVANGVLLQNILSSDQVILSFIPVGTGNDWGKMYGLPTDYKEAVKAIKENNTILQDAGLVSYSTENGKESRYFVNIAGVGLDAVVVFDANRRKERGNGGKIAYLLSLLGAMFKYSSHKVKIILDGKSVYEGELYSANIGICRYSGGGMQQVPHAIPDDGLFDITIIRKVGIMKVIFNVKGLYDGSFVKMKEVSTHRAASVFIDSPVSLMLEADGESLGKPPFEFSILEKALRIVVPQGEYQTTS